MPRALAERVGAGLLGKKSGHGFYRWKRGRVQKAPRSGLPPGGLAERIVAPLLAASAACVVKGIVADADLVDAGLIFGAGFAPFTGGPLNLSRAAAPDAG